MQNKFDAETRVKDWRRPGLKGNSTGKTAWERAFYQPEKSNWGSGWELPEKAIGEVKMGKNAGVARVSIR